MSGKNHILIPNQILFNKGDASNGMFLVRKGELIVFIEQNNKEMILATVQTGGMIGEMALFDNKPRSASVKALTQAEVTHVSNEDFKKLLKQIPGWFQILMSTLSGRLRTTNERLSKLEAAGSDNMRRILVIQRVLGTLDLMWHRDGAKVGNEWQIELEPTIKTLVSMFREDPIVLKRLVAGCVAEGIFTSKDNSYKNKMLSTGTRATLTRLFTFLGQYTALNPAGPLPPEALDILVAQQAFGEKSAYESFSASLQDLELIARKLKITTVDKWKDNVVFLENIHDEIKVLKVDKTISIKANKKSLKEILKFHQVIASLCKAIS